MSSKQDILNKINPNTTYIGTAVKAFVNEVSFETQYFPSQLKKGDVIKVNCQDSGKIRPSVIIKVTSEFTISIPLTSTENVHNLCESSSRFFKDGFFCKNYVVTPIEKAVNNFIGVYDNPKLLNQAIKELRVFIVKNI